MLAALELLIAPEQVVELRALDVSEERGYRVPHTVSGYFDDMDKLADAAMEVAPNAKNVYITLNPVLPDLLARAANRARAAGKGDPSTADKDIVRRRWLPIDIDAKRLAGISSTDAEHEAALARAQDIRAFLSEQGWPEPVQADSGNGAHLLYRIDLPTDDKGLVQQVLHVLSERFSDAAAEVDLTVYNPARIWKLYGSVAKKGDSIPQRPHRLARLLYVPDELRVVTAEQLRALVRQYAEPTADAGVAVGAIRQQKPGAGLGTSHRGSGAARAARVALTPSNGTSASTAGGAFDLATWIADHELDVGEPQPWEAPDGKGGCKWVFHVCPFDAAHTNGSAVLLRFAGGAVAFRCHHNGCTGNDWRALRTLVESAESGDRAGGRDDRDVGDEYDDWDPADDWFESSEPSEPGEAAEGHDSASPSATELTMPPGYGITAAGLTKVTDGPKGERSQHVIAFAQQVIIKSRITNVTDGTHALRLAWQQDGMWHETVAERQEVMNARELVKLARFGFPVTSGNAAELTAYLNCYEAHNRTRLPVERVSARLGWHDDDDHTFLWGHEPLTSSAPVTDAANAADTAEAAGNAVGPNGMASAAGAAGTVVKPSLQFRAASSGDAQLADACRSAGTVEGWIAAVASIGAYPTVQFALYATLTAPLLQVLDVPNFVVDLSGRTSTGKTTALRVAASAVGTPDERATASLVGSWDTTKVAIERRCATSTDLPVFLDDTKRAKKADDVGAILYEVANGKGRDRGNLAGRDRTASWRTVVLSTGEAPATSFTQDGGTRGRVLSFNGLPFRHCTVPTTEGEADAADAAGSAATASLVRALNSGVCQHYGHALPLVVRWVQAHRDEWPQWREAYHTLRNDLPATNEVAYRLAAYFAAVQFTATLVHRAFAEARHALPWTPQVEPLWDAIAAGSDEANTDVRALREVYTWAAGHEAEFYRPAPPEPHHIGFDGDRDRERDHWLPRTGWLGKWEPGDWTEIAFYPDKLRVFLEQAGFRIEEVCAGWRERGWLRVEADGKHPKVRMAAERDSARDPRPRLVVVRRQAFIAVGAVDANVWDVELQETDQAARAWDLLPQLEELGLAVRTPPTQKRLSNQQLGTLLTRGYNWWDAIRFTKDQARRVLRKQAHGGGGVDEADDGDGATADAAQAA